MHFLIVAAVAFKSNSSTSILFFKTILSLIESFLIASEISETLTTGWL